MNKTHKKINLRRKVLQLSAAFFALTVLWACKKEETEIGGDLQKGALNVVTTDTISLVTFTDELDSMQTDEKSVNLLGAYNDPVFGAVNCGIATQILPEGFTQDFPELSEIVMDSVVLALRFTGINYYANLADINVEVFEIDDVLQEDNQTYYLFDTPTTIGDNLVLPGFETVSPNIVANQVVGNDTLPPHLRIRLKTELGIEMVEDSKAGLLDANFATSTFKGLYIKVSVDEALPDFGISSGQGTVLYFSLEDAVSKMTIYYHDGAGVADEFDFDINKNCARYTRVVYDREGTDVKLGLEDKAFGEQEFYMQGCAVRANVELPYIQDFNTNSEGEVVPKIINRAELILPIQDFQSDPFDPATLLFIYRKENDNRSYYTLDYGNGNGVNYDETNKEFRFILTQEIQALLNGEFENTGYRIYSSGFFGSSIERIIFNGSKATLKDRPRLEITYTEY